MTPTITYTTPDGGEDTLPARYEVCDRCRGEGQHTNPAVDGHGITRDEMDELGPDFFEDYMSGVYDVRCEECKGMRVVPVPDEARCTDEQLRDYEEYLHDKWAYQQELAMERRFGC